MLNAATTQPWLNAAKQHPNTLIVMGIYANGAAKLKGHRSWEHRIGFLDCPNCNGKGEIEIKNNGWSSDYEQCQVCAVRFGLKEYIVKRAKALIKEVQQDLKEAKWGGVDIKDPGFIQDYNVLNPLAKEYRRLLYQLWSYQEPEYTELVKN